MPTKLKPLLLNLGLSLVTTVIFVLVMELVFPKILHKLPLSRAEYIRTSVAE